ncbi:hypothetical protein VDGL01_07451 [Verticillium dahliae]
MDLESPAFQALPLAHGSTSPLPSSSSHPRGIAHITRRSSLDGPALNIHLSSRAIVPKAPTSHLVHPAQDAAAPAYVLVCEAYVRRRKRGSSEQVRARHC